MSDPPSGINQGAARFVESVIWTTLTAGWAGIPVLAVTSAVFWASDGRKPALLFLLVFAPFWVVGAAALVGLWARVYRILDKRGKTGGRVLVGLMLLQQLTFVTLFVMVLLAYFGGGGSEAGDWSTALLMEMAYSVLVLGLPFVLLTSASASKDATDPPAPPVPTAKPAPSKDTPEGGDVEAGQ